MFALLLVFALIAVACDDALPDYVDYAPLEPTALAEFPNDAGLDLVPSPVAVGDTATIEGTGFDGLTKVWMFLTLRKGEGSVLKGVESDDYVDLGIVEVVDGKFSLPITIADSIQFESGETVQVTPGTNIVVGATVRIRPHSFHSRSIGFNIAE